LGDSLPSEEKKHMIIFFPGFHGNQDGLKSRLAFPKKASQTSKKSDGEKKSSMNQMPSNDHKE